MRFWGVAGFVGFVGFACLGGSLIGFGVSVAAQAPAPAHYGLGRAATPDEIKARDIDARPDGHGLPPGKGSVREGAPIYAAKCASCHGSKGEGASADRLAWFSTALRARLAECRLRAQNIGGLRTP